MRAVIDTSVYIWDRNKPRDLQNDALVALTARGHGATVVTSNREDFGILGTSALTPASASKRDPSSQEPDARPPSSVVWRSCSLRLDACLPPREGGPSACHGSVSRP
jgi:hypothetical protein